METEKPIQRIILDAGPLITNTPSLSTLLAKSHELFSVPAVIAEIKDRDARLRLENTVLPFLTLREPDYTSLKVVKDFSRRTGDLNVLSNVDLKVLALAYELECESNHGDWRLRRVPGQRGLNGVPPPNSSGEAANLHDRDISGTEISGPITANVTPPPTLSSEQHNSQLRGNSPHAFSASTEPGDSSLSERSRAEEPERSIQHQPSANSHIEETGPEQASRKNADSSGAEDSDSEGWITPSNLMKQQIRHQKTRSKPAEEPKMMQVATITTDFAMQNVLLQMNLNLLSSSLLRVRHLKTYILRCHACFFTTKEMSKQFCPRCGKPTLTRVSCSTSANGEFKFHLKKNMQWSHRGDRFSIPRPVAGTANGKVSQSNGGGKGGWGTELILAEDQKEYVNAVTRLARRKERDLMDEDYMPSILTGERSSNGRRIQIGGGKNINSRKR